jgi:hypothetical protein
MRKSVAGVVCGLPVAAPVLHAWQTGAIVCRLIVPVPQSAEELLRVCQTCPSRAVGGDRIFAFNLVYQRIVTCSVQAMSVDF